jgi:hypothetical protein
METNLSETTLVTTRHPMMSWMAVFGGWLVAMGIAWLLYIFGLAAGFSSFDLNDTEAVAKGVGIGTTIWVILTWAVSLFIGGMFSSWVDGRPDEATGTLHGVAVWGVAMTITALLAAGGVTNLLQGGAALIKGTVAAAAAGGTAAASAGSSRESALNPAGSLLAAQVRQAAGRRGNAQSPAGQTPATTPPAAAGTTAPATAPAATPPVAPPTSGSPAADTASRAIASMDSATSAAVAADLLRGRNDDAKARLAADTGMQPAEVDQALQTLAPQVERAKTQAREAADQARRYTAAVLWGVFLSSLIALIAAALGGWVGAGNVHRVYGTRV